MRFWWSVYKRKTGEVRKVWKAFLKGNSGHSFFSQNHTCKFIASNGENKNTGRGGIWNIPRSVMQYLSGTIHVFVTFWHLLPPFVSIPVLPGFWKTLMVSISASGIATDISIKIYISVRIGSRLPLTEVLRMKEVKSTRKPYFPCIKLINHHNQHKYETYCTKNS